MISSLSPRTTRGISALAPAAAVGFALPLLAHTSAGVQSHIGAWLTLLPFLLAILTGAAKTTTA